MNKIKQRRLELGMTQEELALVLGVKQTAVSMWETTDVRPKSSRLKDVADALGCTVDDLLRKEVKQDASTEN